MFGKVTTTLTSTASKLAKYINVDASLVSRWLKGTRLPGLNSNYNKAIAKYIYSRIKNTFQLNEILRYHMELDPNVSRIKEVEDQILYVLTESRGFSNVEKSHEILEDKGENDTISFQSLSKNDIVINGVHSIGTFIKIILENASRHDGNNRNIYIIVDKFLENMMFYNSEKEIFKLLAKIAQNGWKINVVFERDSNVTVLLKILSIVLPLLRIGNVFTYCLKDACTPRRHDASIVIQGTGALVGFDVTGIVIQEKAMLFRTDAAVDMLCGQIQYYITNFCDSVMRFYQVGKLDNYSKRLIESEYYPGDRIIYKYGFSSLLIPQAIYEKMVKRHVKDQQKQKVIMAFYTLREKAFLDNLDYTDNTHIYSFSFLHEMITAKTFDIYTHIGIEHIEVTTDEIVSVLNNVVALLQKFNRFNIIFQYDSDENYVMLNDFYCSFKQQAYATFELTDTDSSSIVIRMSMESQNVLSAMETYYNNIIEKNRKKNFDRQSVIQQLLNAIEIIETSRE